MDIRDELHDFGVTIVLNGSSKVNHSNYHDFGNWITDHFPSTWVYSDITIATATIIWKVNFFSTALAFI